MGHDVDRYREDHLDNDNDNGDNDDNSNNNNDNDNADDTVLMMIKITVLLFSAEMLFRVCR